MTLRRLDSVPVLASADGAVTLRAYRENDLTRLLEMRNDPEFARWTNTSVPYSPGDARTYLGRLPALLAAGERVAWAIEAGRAGVRRFCGGIDLRFGEDGRAMIGYGLHPDARGRGLLVGAGRLVLDWAFDAVGLEVVSWHCVIGNWASRWAALGMGFRFGGIARKAYARRGELVDVWTGELTRDDARVSLAPPRQPVLAGPGVRLRPFTEADATRIAEACNDEATQHWVPTLPRPYVLADALEFIESCREGEAIHDNWTWCVTAEGSDACVGAITLFGLTARDQAGEIGYWAHPDSRGRGLMSAAAGAVADFALGNGPSHTVRLLVAEANLASQRVAERTGAARVGRLSAYSALRDGTRADTILFLRARQPAADR